MAATLAESLAAGDPEAFAALYDRLRRWPELAARLPFGRLAEPAEIASLAVLGCSPRCGYLSGTVIDVDGGQQFAPA